jgi:pimeloyl-ACP methyl ester carboxylesterase
MGAGECLRVVTALVVAAFGASVAAADEAETATSPHMLAAEAVERLLAKPVCFESSSDFDGRGDVHEFPVVSSGITLSAELYLPRGDGPWPAVILVPGGFNETDLIMLTPRHDAPRLARCGFAAVVYYKRGTGLSGGSYGDATYDDFADDVGSIARRLTHHPHIDPARIGVKGGSSGGLVACVAAARYPEISFVISTSGPIVSWEEESNINIAHALRSRGYADSLVEQVLPLWRRHHAMWAAADTAGLETVASEIVAMRECYDPFLLPTPYNEVFSDSNLVFLWPEFRSASHDYLSEMKTMRAKWLSIYGEKDRIVPVTSCVRNIAALTKASGNEAYTVIVLPGVDHSFFRTGTRDQVPVLRIVVNWLMANVAKK